MSAEREWDVDVYGYDTARFKAETKAKAFYQAFLSFREAFGRGITFRDFIGRGVTVRPA